MLALTLRVCLCYEDCCNKYELPLGFIMSSTNIQKQSSFFNSDLQYNVWHLLTDVIFVMINASAEHHELQYLFSNFALLLHAWTLVL